MSRAMESALQGSSLHVLLILTSRMLARSGFGDVQLLDRREPRQKSRFGGHELRCDTVIGGIPTKVVGKVLVDPPRLRNLDELAGVVDRERADLGLLITPHRLTKGADQHRSTHTRSRIEVIDGPMLAEKLMALGIGVRGTTNVDYAFFALLEEESRRLLACLRKGHP